MRTRGSGIRWQWLATCGMLVLAAAPAFAAQPAVSSHWMWSESVRFAADHDPQRIELDGARKRNVGVLYDGLTWEQVDAWRRGKTLLLAYSKKTGTVLVDPDNGKSVTVLDGLKTQPIDLLLEACQHKAVSKQDIDACYGDAYGRWDAQMNLWYRRFMASKDTDLGKVAKASLRKAQRQWLKYRDAQFDALNDLYGYRSGTIWPLVVLNHRLALVKARALALASYLQAL